MRQSPAPMRHLLELLAIAGRPLERDLLLSAADPEQIAERGHEWLIALQRSGLVREVADTLDTFHDRVRETIAESVEPELKQRHHARLAASEQLAPSPDVEFLAYHHEQAGQLEPAARHAEAAGDRARDKLAADRAAELYAIALSCLGEPAPLRLLEKLADATAFTGRLAAAAPIYVRAAACPECTGTRALRLRLRATEMMLRRGKVKESVELAQPVLQAVGLRYPSSAAEAALSIVVNLAQLRSNGRNVPNGGWRNTASTPAGSSQMLEAGLHHLQGDRETAAQLYGAAADAYERLAMRGYVQMSRLRQSELLVGAEAEALRASAERWFADQGIRKPQAWTRMFAPIGDAG